jgi:hypothetical protein
MTIHDCLCQDCLPAFGNTDGSCTGSPKYHHIFIPIARLVFEVFIHQDNPGFIDKKSGLVQVSVLHVPNIAITAILVVQCNFRVMGPALFEIPCIEKISVGVVPLSRSSELPDLVFTLNA